MKNTFNLDFDDDEQKEEKSFHNPFLGLKKCYKNNLEKEKKNDWVLKSNY